MVALVGVDTADVSTGSFMTEEASQSEPSASLRGALALACARSWPDLASTLAELVFSLTRAHQMRLSVGAASSTGGQPTIYREVRPQGATHRRPGPLIEIPFAVGDVQGMLAVDHDEDDEPTSSERDVLDVLARLVENQIDRLNMAGCLARLDKEQGLQVQRLSRLHRLEAELSRAESVVEVVQVLSERISTLITVDRVTFAQVGMEEGKATLYGVHGASEIPCGTTLPIDVEEFDQTYRARTSYYNADHRHSDDEAHRRLSLDGIYSSINLGVYLGERPVGTLNLGSRRVDGFSVVDRALVETLASFMGSTLERLDVHARLVREAHHDALTGLLRRQIFDERLAREILSLKGTGCTSAVCFMDLDQFKLVNDTAGHVAGDLLLVEVARRLGQFIHADDLLCRVGGDEFIMILRNRNKAAYREVCEQILDVIGQPFMAGEQVMVNTLSIGLAYIDCSTPDVKEAVASADAACYVSKARGGNRVSVARDGDNEQSDHKTAASVLARVREAVEQSDLQLYGQPIRPLDLAGIHGVEVLVRMKDNAGQMISPDRFIPVAERYRSIAELDSWVVRESLSRWKCADSTHTKLFINLSPTSVSTDGFVDSIRAIALASGVPPRDVCFEITETGTMRDFDTVRRFVIDFKNLGFLFALDDFGVGLSSLSHLQQLPVDFLKIDGSLVRGIEANPLNTAMISSIKTMADALGLATVAEHVENQAALDNLARLGISNVQGYALGRPDQLNRVLRTPAIQAGDAVGTGQTRHRSGQGWPDVVAV